MNQISAPDINVPDGGLAAPQRRWVVLCVLLGVILANLDSAIANIALPTIAHELAASDAATVWVVNGYQLATTVCLLPVAALGGILGLKRVYAFGLIVFGLASLACALSPTLGALVGARMAQGVGSACLAALGPALIRGVYPRANIASGLALVALSVAVSGAVGPTIAALILSVATWPWLFLVNLPVCLLAIPLFIAKAPASPRGCGSLDRVGTVLSAVALGLVVVGVDGLGGARIGVAIAEIAVGLAVGAILVWQQRVRRDPLLPLDLLRIPLFALSVCTSVCSYATQILAYVSLPFLFQTVMHRSQVATGLLITPWPLLVAFAAPAAGRLCARYPAVLLGTIGLAVLSAGMLLLATMPAAPADWDIAWRMALCGIGFGFYQTPNNTVMMTTGPASRSGAASGMIAVARTVGWSLGSALVAVVFALDGPAGAFVCLGLGSVLAATGVAISSGRLFART